MPLYETETIDLNRVARNFVYSQGATAARRAWYHIATRFVKVHADSSGTKPSRTPSILYMYIKRREYMNLF